MPRETGNISHVEYALKFSTAPVETRVVEYFPADSKGVVPDPEIECPGIALRHLEVEVRKDHQEVIIVCVILGELLGNLLPGKLVGEAIGQNSIVVAGYLHYRDIAVIADGGRSEVLGKTRIHEGHEEHQD